jgi:ABC-type sugar transport system, ATPase component
VKTEVLRAEQIFAPPYLSGFNMDVYAGELDALIGIDYIGMDYLFRVFQYNCPVLYGRIFYDGIRVNDQDGMRRRSNKVVVINKKSALIDTLSVAENLFVVRNGYRKLYVGYRLIENQTKQVLEQLQFSVDPGTAAGCLSPCGKTILELAKAWVSGVHLVILGNISTYLTAEDVDRVVSVVRILAARGMAFLYVCNHHQEAFQYCDRCFLMKKGRIVKCLEKDQMSDAIIERYSYVFTKWVRNEQHQKLYENPVEQDKEGFSCRFGNFSFSVKKGETVVLLDSDNRLINDMFAAMTDPGAFPDAQLRVDGEPWKKRSRKNVLIPFNPTAAMLFPQMSVLDNICFTLDGKIHNFWLTKKKRNAIAQDLYPVFGDAIYAPSLYDLDDSVLYDVVYQRVLLQHPSFVCVMQPLASADMMMRLRLLEYFDAIRSKGITVCILAFALSDSLEIANRLLVIKDGKIDREYDRSDFSSFPGISGSRPL